jgi:hypothetical protein
MFIINAVFILISSFPPNYHNIDFAQRQGINPATVLAAFWGLLLSK